MADTGIENTSEAEAKGDGGGDAPAKQTPKQAPRRGRPPGTKNGTGAEKKLALYHIFRKGEKGALLPVIDTKARNAELAVSAFIENPGKEKKLAEEVSAGKASVIVIPERNYTEVGAQEEVKRTVKIKAIK